MIKRVDSTGGPWLIYATAVGLGTATQHSLSLESPAAQDANLAAGDKVDTSSTGFQVIVSDPNLNALNGQYIWTAISS
jgi:hypothetical protein